MSIPDPDIEKRRIAERRPAGELRPDDRGQDEVSEALEEAQRHGTLIVSAPVFCELHACPGVTGEMVTRFLRDTGIVTDFQMGEHVWQEAATRFARYAIRRRKSGGASPKRMLVDFIVGAHALLLTDCMLTLDKGRYARDFPELKLM